MYKKPLYVNILLSFLAAMLFSFSFPAPGIGYLVWIALVPWFIIISTGHRAGLFSYIIGILFFVYNLSWLRFVTYFGWFSLSLYLALYFFVCGIILQFLRRRLRLPHVFAAPFVWVALEYLRSFPYSGFPWFFAGHSQYLNLPLIQIADITGVYGISFLIVVVNGAIADLTEPLLFKHNYKSGRDSIAFSANRGNMFYFTIIFPCLLLSLTLAYGYFGSYVHPILREGPKVCVVQGNIPQGVKIMADEKQQEEILLKYTNLSLSTVEEEIDMIVWPETMVPGILNINPRILDRKIDRLSNESVQRLTDATAANLVLGGTAIDVKDASPLYFNSAFYFDGKGRFVDRYDKIFLVPFGEFIPFENWLSFLSHLVPYNISLSGGTERTVFELDTKKGYGNCKFAVIICYEDTIAPLVRKFRKDGAEFMINITNDAWFCNSPELDQHLAVMVFRAVENRISIARAANSGISSFVAPNGEIYDSLAKGGEYKEIDGILCNRIRFENSKNSWYTNYGDVFAISCLSVTALLLLLAWRKRIFA